MTTNEDQDDVRATARHCDRCQIDLTGRMTYTISITFDRTPEETRVLCSRCRGKVLAVLVCEGLLHE